MMATREIRYSCNYSGSVVWLINIENGWRIGSSDRGDGFVCTTVAVRDICRAGFNNLKTHFVPAVVLIRYLWFLTRRSIP